MLWLGTALQMMVKLGVAVKQAEFICNAVQGKDPLECLNTASTFATFDVLVANILKGPLTELAPRLASYVHPGGRIAMSGILEHQVPELQEVFDPYFCEWEIYTESRWALLTGRRKALEPL